MSRLLLGLLALSLAASGADLSARLLAAAADGKTDDVKALLEKGAPVDARDRKDRTPLMLAAQHGYADTVRLLLAKGAHAEARDRDGFTAFALAVFAPAGHLNHQDVLQTLPPPARLRLAVTSEVNLARAQSSCFMSKGELPGEVSRLHLDSLMREEFLSFAGASGKGLVQIVAASDSADAADAVAALTLLPGVTCSGADGDRLSVDVHVRVVRSRDQQVLLEKTFGAGVNILRGQTVNNPAQYGPVFMAWVRPLAAPIYWAVTESLYRTF